MDAAAIMPEGSLAEARKPGTGLLVAASESLPSSSLVWQGALDLAWLASYRQRPAYRLEPEAQAQPQGRRLAAKLAEPGSKLRAMQRPASS